MGNSRDSRLRDNFNRRTAARDNAMSMDTGIAPHEVRKNYVGGEKAYHRDVAKYAAERGEKYGGSAQKAADHLKSQDERKGV